MRPSLFRTPLIIAALLLGLPAQAQYSALLPSKGATTHAPTPTEVVRVSDPKQELADAKARVKDAQDVLQRLQAQLKQPGLSEDARKDLLKQFNLQQTLFDRYSQQVDYLKQLDVLAQKIADAKQARDNWTPPAGTPPWSVVEGDAVRNEMLLQESQLAQLDKELGLFASQLVGLSQEKAAEESRLRQLKEAAEKSGDAGKQQLAVAQARLALVSAVLLRTDLERRVKEKDRALLEVRLETSKKTWDYYAGRFVLTPTVLAAAKGDLQSIIDRNRDAELKALAAFEVALARLDKAQSAFVGLDPKKSSPEKQAQLQAALDIAQAEEVAAQSNVDRLRRMIELGGYGLQIWDARADIYADPPPDASRLEEIAQRVRTGVLRVRQSRDLLQQSLSTKEQEAFDIREALLTSKSALEQRVLTARLKSATAQTDEDRLILAALERFEQYLMILQSELGVHAEGRSFKERMIAYGQRMAALVKSLWQYELFTVDDVVVADGKEIKTTRSVTVGKSIGAIGILLFGFFLISRLIAASVGLAERRLGLKSSAASIVRRWLTVLATGTLIILSFNLVQIPLSVFAFLGGALAIGAGFGTQNLLKNLISGVMLLVERPIRIGDLVEMDGIKGRVTSIGIRFSTIHSGDGVDTLIPNSELVEKKLTNWTYSNPDIRREFKVGVAYGADPVAVKNLMREAALNNPEVMRQPEPMVVLDDFADSALIFTLRFWIKVGSGTDGRLVDSDLRCDILGRLKAAGIELPYPQRDVHLSANAPLPVSVVDPKSAAQ